MRDWEEYVRNHLSSLSHDRESRIVCELAAQLEDFYHEAIARGMTEADADADARVQIPDWTHFGESLIDANRKHVRSAIERWSDRFILADFWQDVCHTARTLAKQPGFAAAAVFTLALGIGATTAIFSVVNGVLIKPLPYPNPDELVRIVHSIGGIDQPYFSDAIYLNYVDNTQAFQDVGV